MEFNEHELSLATIENFTIQWNGELHTNYKDAANYVERMIRSRLSQENIRYETHSREKGELSLRNKLFSRHLKKPYTDMQSIKEDIVDLAGVRVVLENIEDKNRTWKIIAEELEVCRTVKHPKADNITLSNEGFDQQNEYREVFKGYEAVHFHAKIRTAGLSTMNDIRHLLNIFVEIQVLSQCTHIWAELQHDSLYKTPQGAPSKRERMFLDGLDGIFKVEDIFKVYFHDLKEERIRLYEAADEKIESELKLAGVIDEWLAKHEYTLRINQQANVTNPSPLTALLKLTRVNKVELFTPRKLCERLERVNFERCLRPELSTTAFANHSLLCAQYDPLGQNVAICIMHNILEEHEFLEADEADSDTKAIERLKVLTSTVIWLDELFGDDDDLERRVLRQLSDQMKSCFLWLLDNPNRTWILKHGESPTKCKALDTINDLWAWFLHHQEETVQFSFKLARANVLKNFPEDIHRLQGLWSKWSFSLKVIDNGKSKLKREKKQRHTRRQNRLEPLQPRKTIIQKMGSKGGKGTKNNRSSKSGKGTKNNMRSKCNSFGK